MSVGRRIGGRSVARRWTCAALLVLVVALLAGVWGAPRVSASVRAWLATPPTKAALVTVQGGLPITAVDLGDAAAAAPRAAAGGGATEASGGSTGTLDAVRRAAAGAPAAVVDAGFRFNMLGALFKGAPAYDRRVHVRLRTSLDRRTWSDWQEFLFDRAEGGPGSASDPGDTCSEPLWIGEGRYVQYQILVAGGNPAPRVGDLRFSFINTVGDGDLADRLEGGLKGAVALIAGVVSTPEAYGLAERPPIVTRAEWGANEALRGDGPWYAPVRVVFIHHTAGSNSYSRSEAPAVVRGTYYYHTRVRGWSDIGYNFLVDRYGTIYEGRYGGMTKGVIGAQTLGFNTGSAGVSLMGNFVSTAPTTAAVRSLERLLAWKLDVHHLDPLGTDRLVCGTTQKWRAGQVVSFPVIAGHRQATFTSCPGSAMFAKLPAVRAAVAAIGQPKIFYPRLSPAAFSPDGDGFRDKATVTFRLSQVAAWRVEVRDAAGVTVRAFSGEGTAGRVAWDGRSAQGERLTDGTYRAVVAASRAGRNARPATLSVRLDTTPPAMSDLAAKPAVVSPNGDGVADATLLSCRLSEAGYNKVAILDDGGSLVRLVHGWRAAVAGVNTARWAGKIDGADGPVVAPDGIYDFRIDAKDAAGNRAAARAQVTVNNTLGYPRAAPLYFSPNGDGKRDTSALGFRLTRAARVTVTVTHASGATVRSFSLGSLEAGGAKAVWDGLDAAGLQAANGRYRFTVAATNGLGSVKATARVFVDRYRPRIGAPTELTISLGARARVAYTVSDRYSPQVRVAIVVTNRREEVVRTFAPVWLDSGERHVRSYQPSSRGTYTITIRATDRAGNAQYAPGVTALRVR